MWIERNDPRLGRISPPWIEPQWELPVVELDALEAVLDHLADRGLAAVRGIDELSHLLDEDPPTIRAKRRGQQRPIASDESQRAPHALQR